MEGSGRTLEVAGGYSDYQRYRLSRGAEGVKVSAEKPRAKFEAAAKPKRSAKLSYKDQRELDSLPARIETLSAEAAALEARLADPSLYRKDPAGFAELSRALAAKRDDVAAAEERWLELEAEREALESGKASNGELTS
jgi:ATP-binding cassette subfamily F protein uup